MIISNCTITHLNSKVQRSFNISGPIGYHTGVDVYCRSVFAGCQGAVVYTNKMQNGYVVIIQYDSNNCIKYTNLQSLNILQGDLVTRNTVIGYCDSFVHFEYLTVEKNKYPIRVNQATYYKQDPISVLSSYQLLPDTNISDIVLAEPNGIHKIELSEAMSEEFTNHIEVSIDSDE